MRSPRRAVSRLAIFSFASAVHGSHLFAVRDAPEAGGSVRNTPGSPVEPGYVLPRRACWLTACNLASCSLYSPALFGDETPLRTCRRASATLATVCQEPGKRPHPVHSPSSRSPLQPVLGRHIACFRQQSDRATRGGIDLHSWRHGSPTNACPLSLFTLRIICRYPAYSTTMSIIGRQWRFDSSSGSLARQLDLSTCSF